MKLRLSIFLVLLSMLCASPASALEIHNGLADDLNPGAAGVPAVNRAGADNSAAGKDAVAPAGTRDLYQSRMDTGSFHTRSTGDEARVQSDNSDGRDYGRGDVQNDFDGRHVNVEPRINQ